MHGSEVNKEKGTFYFKLLAKGLFSFLAMIVVIFALAGRLTYWQGWLFNGILALIVVIASMLFVNKTDLIEERAKPGPGTKWWDKVFYALYVPAFLSIVVIAPLDAGRYGWTPPLPVIFYVASCTIFVLSNIIYLWAMWVNRFFSSTVRIQTDRGHEVVRTGPYRLVRHPGYVGGILLGIGTATVLGSLWALTPAGAVAVLLMMRTYLEDTTLQRELPGYADYAHEVKYRLLPGVW